MAKRFRNRSAREFKVVLRAFGCEVVHKGSGDDQVWGRKEAGGVVVLVPDRDSEILILPTAMDMVRKMEKLGISRREILRWWLENGFGE